MKLTGKIHHAAQHCRGSELISHLTIRNEGTAVKALARAIGEAITPTVGDKLEKRRISSLLCIQKGYRGV